MPRARLFLKRRQVALGQLDDAAGAEDGLDDDGCHLAGTLAVDHVPAEFELLPPVVVAIAIEGRAVGVGCGQRQDTRNGGAVAAAAAGIGGGGSAAGDTVPGAVEGHDLEATGVGLGHPKRRLVRFASCRQR